MFGFVDLSFCVCCGVGVIQGFCCLKHVWVLGLLVLGFWFDWCLLSSLCFDFGGFWFLISDFLPWWFLGFGFWMLSPNLRVVYCCVL